MDYDRAGTPKPGKKSPKHREHNQHGSPQKPFGQREDKAALLERMKAAAKAKKTG